MESYINLINGAFKDASIELKSLSQVSISPNSFGDFAVDAKTNIGTLRILRDRGQFFIDVACHNGEIIPGHILAPELLDIYNNSTWTLIELLTTFKKSKFALSRGKL